MPSLHKVISDTLGTIYGGSIADNDNAASKVLRHIFANGYDLKVPHQRDPVSPHMHVAGTTIGKDIDECAKCGHDLRDPIHANQ